MFGVLYESVVDCCVSAWSTSDVF